MVDFKAACNSFNLYNAFEKGNKLFLTMWAILLGCLWRHSGYHGNNKPPPKEHLNSSVCKSTEKLNW